MSTSYNPVAMEEAELNTATEYALWKKRVEQAKGLTIHQVPFRDARCAEWADCFVDHAHMNLTGAEALLLN